MRIVLLSSYEMGRQPFGLASPAAWLRAAGFDVDCVDLSRDRFAAESLSGATLIGVFLPMHTATRLAAKWLPHVRAAAPQAHYCAYGIYAALNRERLQALGVTTILGGEFEADLVALATALRDGQALPSLPVAAPQAAVPRLAFQVPDRRGLPELDRYARLETGSGEARITGYTEASRGCKHTCRHCPIVPVYQGQFRVVPAEVVLADIRQQVGAGAAHITFGDPDFFNGPTHASRIVTALHREFPTLSYDVTIKVEHLCRQADLLPLLRDTGCVLITTAVESFDDEVLQRLNKGHQQADFLRALETTRALGLALNPTFVGFTPWTTPQSFRRLLTAIAELELTESVAPVQYGIRLLIPAGSWLLRDTPAPPWLGAWDAEALSYIWRHPNPAVDALCESVQSLVARASKAAMAREEIFRQVAALAGLEPPGGVRRPPAARPRSTVPYLNEPWFC